jgi:hypothetical protein
VIDHQSKGYLTWKDSKYLCQQSFTLCVDAETKGLKSTDDRQIKPLFEGDKRRYVKYETNPAYNSEKFEEEMSKYHFKYNLIFLLGNFFADLIFDKIYDNQEKTASQLDKLKKFGGALGVKIQKKVKKMVDKEKQQISIDSIKKLLLGGEGKAEESILFELLCGFSTDLDPVIEAKKKELERVKDDDEESVTLFYA